VRRQASPSAYRVRSGDTLFGIAWQNGMDYREVARWNGIRAPYRIYAGQTLRLRPPPAVRQPPRSTTVSKAKRPAPPPRSQVPAKRPTPSVAATRDLTWRWPANGRVSSTFKPADPLRKGIKIAGGEGSAIVAAERGKVVYSGSGLIGYGRLIIVKHNDNYLSAYGYNRELLVNEGDQVTKGQRIAAMGRANNGQPLLHFEIRRDGKPVDPLRLLPKR
jgi:lipoprotein NlpD